MRQAVIRAPRGSAAGLRAKVGGHLVGRFCRLAPSPPARRPDRDSGDLEIRGRGFAPNVRGSLNAPQRPSQPPQRDDLLFLFFAQDIHSMEGKPHVTVNVLDQLSRWPVFR